MVRSDLRWALDAVLPHVGKLAGTAVVGLTSDGRTLDVYATDRYTVAVANIDTDCVDLDVRLPVGEARDLLRFVRPSLVKHESEWLRVVTDGPELHVGLVNEDEEVYDSAVFETVSSPVSSANLRALIAQLDSRPTGIEDLVYWPRLFGRFAKAERVETDRLTLSPKRLQERYGAAVVTVGDRFVGAICGMTYEAPQSEEAA